MRNERLQTRETSSQAETGPISQSCCCSAKIFRSNETQTQKWTKNNRNKVEINVCTSIRRKRQLKSI